MAEFTDANGHYTLPGLPKGNYEIEFLPFELNYVAEYYDDERFEEDADLIHLAEGKSLTGIDASLAVGGQITGEVLSAIGSAPLEGVLVCASSQTDSAGSCARTDASGDYTIMALATDSYIIGFDPPPSLNYFGQWYEEAKLRKQAKWVPVKEGSTTPGIDGALDEAAGIAGTVLDAETGRLLDEIQVCAIEAGGEEFSRCSSTSPDGNYLVGGMSSGEYEVVFSPEWGAEDGYFTQYYDHAPSQAAAATLALTAPSLTTGIDAKLTSEHPLGGDTAQMPIGGASLGPEVGPNTDIPPQSMKIRRRSASFSLSPKPPGSWFECRIDRHRYKRCASPVTYRRLRPGRHIFEARTVTGEGDVGPPARFKFKIGLRPRGGDSA